MEWIDRMKSAIDAIEDSLTETIDIKRIASTAYLSPFHFQRIFLILTGMTVFDYVRKRRLTLAAHELAISSVKVVDVALKYGYETPESFTKAFRKAHGITPSEARSSGVSLKAFPRISFQLSLKGDKDMDYKIVQKDRFHVTGKAIRVSTVDGNNGQVIANFWVESNGNGTSERVCALAPDKPLLGVCMEMEDEAFTYLIAVETEEGGSTSQEFVTKEIPNSTWAVFTSIGPMPTAIQKVWERIYQEWFPATGYEHAGGPDLEVYLPGDIRSDDYRCEVWIPILKK